MWYAHSKDTNNSNEWSCPNCGSENIDFNCPNCDGEYCWYEFNCLDCNAEGVQLYRLQFVGYNYDVEKDDDGSVD